MVTRTRFPQRLIPALAITALLVCAFFATPTRGQLLVWSMGNNQSETQGVANWLQSSGQFSSVTAINSTTLTLNDLTNYQQVLFFSNSGGDSAVGDVLADYADTGRRLVVATFSWADQGSNTLAGRFITGQISPFVFNRSTLYSTSTLGQIVDPALFAGVSAITGYYRDSVSITPGAHILAYWADGVPLAAVKGNVIAISLFPDDSYGNVSGDHRQLFINALSLQAIPEPSTSALLALGLGALVWLHRRR